MGYFRSVLDKDPARASLESIMKNICNGKWKEPVERIRSLRATGDKAEADKVKRMLCAFTTSAICVGGHALAHVTDYTGMVGLDFDKVPAEVLEEKIKLCQECVHTMAMFKTCSNEGFRVIVCTDGGQEDHLVAFRGVAQLYETLLGLKCDEHCKDVNRLSFVSYDPQGYYKEDAELFSVPSQTSDVSELLDTFLRYNSFEPGGRNAAVFKFGLQANSHGYTQWETAALLIARYSAPDFSVQEIDAAIASAFKENRVLNPPVKSFQKQEKGAQIGALGALVPPMPPLLPKEDPLEGVNTYGYEYFTGNAPTLSDFVYEHLPRRLRRAIEHCKNRKQRDVMLISAIVVLSACLPKVTGRYGDYTYSPQLFFFLLAEAASGKGEMSFAGKLFEAIDERFKNNYVEDMKRFNRVHDRWLHDKETAYKDKRDFDLPEPEKPKEIEMSIPANISKSMIHHHLDQNGEVGGIMFDTEANTLNTANKMECGNFVSDLCKMFHHEVIGSSFRILGKMLCVKHPKMALALSGTPDQLGKLIPDKRSGLFSRFLFLTLPGNVPWDDQTPDYEKVSTQGFFEHESLDVLNDYDFLNMHATDVRLSPVQWKTLNQTYCAMLKDVVLEDDITLQSIVKRHGLMTLRIAMVLTALRKADDKGYQPMIYCSDVDFNAAMEITKCCMEHSFLLSTTLPDNATGMLPMRIARQMQVMFDLLPDTFTLKEALEAGASLGINKRSIYKFLAKAVGVKIEKLEPGVYRKL